MINKIKQIISDENNYPLLIIICLLIIIIFPKIKKNIEGYENSGFNIFLSDLYGNSRLSSFVDSITDTDINLKKHMTSINLNAQNVNSAAGWMSWSERLSRYDTSNPK